MPEPSPDRSLSRRDWFRRLVKPASAEPKPAPTTTHLNSSPPPLTPTSYEPNPAQVAIIAGRFCLAYQHSFCTTCSERCPVTDAIVIEDGYPRIVPDVCTGCAICHSVCPAPEANAIRLIPRRPAPAKP